MCVEATRGLSSLAERLQGVVSLAEELQVEGIKGARGGLGEGDDMIEVDAEQGIVGRRALHTEGDVMFRAMGTSFTKHATAESA